MATTYPPGSLDQVLWAVRAYVMQTAPAGLLRTPELRNCHIRGNFVPAGGVSLAPPRQRGKRRSAIPQPSRPLRDTLPYSGRAKKETDLVSEIRLRVLKGGNYLSSRVVRPSTLGGEGVRHADSPCGASAYARTEKLPYQGQFRARRRRFPCAAETESAALLCPK